MAELSELEIEAYLGEAHVASLVTIRPDGSPHVAPVWFLWEDGHAFVIAGVSAVKVKNIRGNASVALSVVIDQRPYRYVVLEGQAKVSRDNLAHRVERICLRYDGPVRGTEFARELLAADRTVVIEITVNKMPSWKEDE